MEDIVKNIDPISFPRPTSLVLFVLTVGFNLLDGLWHVPFNTWVAGIAGILSIDHYLELGLVKFLQRTGHIIIAYFKHGKK